MKELLRIAWPALLLTVLLCAPWLASPMFLDDWHNIVQAREAPWTFSGLARGFSFLGHEELATWNLPEGLHYHFFRPLLVASFKLDLVEVVTYPPSRGSRRQAGCCDAPPGLGTGGGGDGRPGQLGRRPRGCGF